MKGKAATITVCRWMAVVVLPAVVLLNGCFASQTAKRYFELRPPATETPLQKTDKAILVEPVASEGIYDDFRIVYRTSPYQVNFYSYDFWANKPADLIQSAIFSFLQTSGVFDEVGKLMVSENPEVVFKSRLKAIEEIDGGNVRYARLALEMEMVDYKTGGVILKHSFDRRLRLPKRDIVLLPKVISDILEKELRFMITAFVEQLRTKS